MLWQERRQLYDNLSQSIAAGELHSAVVDTFEGELFTFGNAEEAYLGHSTIGEALPAVAAALLPKCLPMMGERFIAVAAHSLHTLALTASGQVYSFGDGRCGQLGHGD